METSLIHRQERFLLKIGWAQTTAPEQKETRERERKDKRARQWSQRNIGPGLDSHTPVELQDNSRTPRTFTTKGDVCYVVAIVFFCSIEKFRTFECQWDKSWSPDIELDPCEWIQCINPPQPPQEANLVSNYQGVRTKVVSNILTLTHQS